MTMARRPTSWFRRSDQHSSSGRMSTFALAVLSPARPIERGRDSPSFAIILQLRTTLCPLEAASDRGGILRILGCVVPPVGEAVDDIHYPVEAQRQTSEHVNVTLPVDLADQRDDVPPYFNADTVWNGPQELWYQLADDLFSELLIRAQEHLKQVAPADDTRDPAAFVDHDQPPNIPFLHHMRGVA